VARVTALTRSGHQLVDRGFRQVLALPVISILGSTTARSG